MKTLPVDTVFSIWIDSQVSQIVLEIQRLKGHLFFLSNSKVEIFSRKSVFFSMFIGVQYSFQIFDW